MTTKPEDFKFRKLLPVFLIVLIDLMGLTIIIPLLPLYAASFGASAATIGLLGAAYPFMQFIGAPLLGGLSDRYGRKPVLVLSQLGTFLSLLLLGVADTLLLLFVARMLDGLTGGNISTAQAVITDNTSERNRTRGLGLIGAAFGIGFTIGPVIAFLSLAFSGNNYHVPAFVAAGFSFFAFVLTWFYLEESLPPEKRGQGGDRGRHRRSFSPAAMLAALQRPQVGFLLLLLFLFQVAFGTYQQIFTLFTLNRLGLNAAGNALVFVFLGILIVMVQGYYVGRWSARVGERRLIFMGLLVLALGTFLTATTPRQPVPWYDEAALQAELEDEGSQESLQIDLPPESQRSWWGLLWLLLAMIPAAVGGGVMQPSVNSLITQRVAPFEVGAILGISASFLSAANALAPALGGLMFQVLGAPSPFLGGTLLLLLLFGLARQHVPAASGQGA